VLDDTNLGPGGVAAAYIRGIGVSEVEKNFDPAVGVVVDGIFIGSLSGGIQRSIDLARVEILRGPQGTLFWRNTIGGVINLERSRPTMETGGKLMAGYGNYDTTTLEGIFNFGNGDTWGIKLSGAYRDQSEGYMDNSVTGTDEGFSEYHSGGINALFAPQDGLEIELTYNAERTDQDSPPLLNAGQPGQLFCDVFGYCSPSVHTPVSGDRYVSVRDCGPTALPGIPDPNVPWVPPGYDAPTNCSKADFNVDSYQAEVRWDINEQYRLDYLWGRWESDEDVVIDWDAVPAVLFHTYRPGT
jgi:iron complex outermembrane receptor protein